MAQQAEERRCGRQGVGGIGIVCLVVLVAVRGPFPGSSSDDGDGVDDDDYDDDDDFLWELNHASRSHRVGQ